MRKLFSFFKVILFLLILNLLSARATFASSSIGYTQYALGGLTGTVVGLGLGHAVQERWASENGWIFTVVELAGVALIVSDKPKYTCTGYSGSTTTTNCTTVASDATTAGAALIISARLVEIIDIWWLPDNMQLGFVPDIKKPQATFVFKF